MNRAQIDINFPLDDPEILNDMLRLISHFSCPVRSIYSWAAVSENNENNNSFFV